MARARSDFMARSLSSWCRRLGAVREAEAEAAAHHPRHAEVALHGARRKLFGDRVEERVALESRVSWAASMWVSCTDVVVHMSRFALRSSSERPCSFVKSALEPLLRQRANHDSRSRRVSSEENNAKLTLCRRSPWRAPPGTLPPKEHRAPASPTSGGRTNDPASMDTAGSTAHGRERAPRVQSQQLREEHGTGRWVRAASGGFPGRPCLPPVLSMGSLRSSKPAFSLVAHVKPLKA